MVKIPFLSVIFLFCCIPLAMLATPKRFEEKGSDRVDWNPVEKIYLQKSGREGVYPGEHLFSIETRNVCELGKLTALSFIFWVYDHPEGVVALPTGKTPELFIEYLKYYKQNWNDPKVQADLRHYEINFHKFPETKRLKFVQLDEFYPIDVAYKKSFTSYVKNYYLDLLEIPPENVLGMDLCATGILKEKGYKNIFPDGKVDLSLLDRQPKTEVQRWQKLALQEAVDYCQQYENKIREWGGIGFFLGGIGPDGHIAFNMQGSPHDSKTRLVQMNYPTAAQVATDLGGIEFSRDKTAITIGLDTIISDKNTIVIIMCAGEAKASVIANAIEKPKHTDFPATAFQGHKGTRFYLTKGAASRLRARRVEDVQRKSWVELSEEGIDDVVIELALKERKRVVDLNETDFLSYERSSVLLEKYNGAISNLLGGVEQRLKAKIEKGLDLPKNTTILHTGPHHDDVMLSYHSLMRQLLGSNENYFVYLTSGFNSVANSYMVKTLNAIPEDALDRYSFAIFEEDHNTALHRHIQANAHQDSKKMSEAEGIIMLQNVSNIFGANDVDALKEKVRWLKDDYFSNRIPGDKDSPQIQILKGTVRESESERMLLIAGITLPQIYHMRTKFYTGNYFDPIPSIEKDAKPLLDLYHKVKPSLITVAFDPEGTGPDTHYKVLQVVAEAMRMDNFDPSIKVWGYRNVWHRFKFSDANLISPASEEEIADMGRAFLNCFSTQKTASFPAPNYDGPFSGLVEKIQIEQCEQLKILLGENFFTNHKNPLVRNARGFILIKEMIREEFFDYAQELKSRVELITDLHGEIKP